MDVEQRARLDKLASVDRLRGTDWAAPDVFLADLRALLAAYDALLKRARGRTPVARASERQPACDEGLCDS